MISAGPAQTTIPVVVRTQSRSARAAAPSAASSLAGTAGASRRRRPTTTYSTCRPASRTSTPASRWRTTRATTVIAYLIDPSGQNLGYSTNVTLNASGSPESTLDVNLYHVDPQPGQWTLVLAWQNPVTGQELSEPFTGAIRFNQAQVSSNLPRTATLTSGTTYTYNVTVRNAGQSPEAFFADPRLHSQETLRLADLNGNEADISLPLPAGPTFPYYFVPTQTSQLQASLTGTVPVDFDSSYFPGDPDVEGIQSGDSASLTLTEPEVSPGLWDLVPDETGPYPATGAPPATASASMSAVTRAFDPAVTSSTGDMWSYFNDVTSTFSPVYVPAGGSATITVQITPNGTPGSSESGTLFVDDATIAGLYGLSTALPNGDELAAIPYSYRVAG